MDPADGGEKDSEYPVTVDLFYTDIYGKDLHWYMGFYNLELPPNSPYPRPSGERVPLGVWYTYESPNLFELLGDTRPARVNARLAVEDYNAIGQVSGHDEIVLDDESCLLGMHDEAFNHA